MQILVKKIVIKRETSLLQKTKKTKFSGALKVESWTVITHVIWLVNWTEIPRMLLFEELHWFKLLPDSYAREASNLNCWLEPEECVDGALQAAVRAVPALANANWQHLPFSLHTDWDKKLPIILQEDGRLMEPIPSFAYTPDRAVSGQISYWRHCPDLLPPLM